MRELRSLGTSNITCVMVGERDGADTLGRSCAEELGIDILPFPADWGMWGAVAGLIRNSQMLQEGDPSMVLAFHEDLKKSYNTANMVRLARSAGLLVKVIR